MKNEKSVYLLSIILIKKDYSDKNLYLTDSYSGYFTNLKLVYGLLSGKNLKSYSTFSRQIKKSNNYMVKNLYVKIKDEKVFCNRILIRKINLNNLYTMGLRKIYFNIEDLIIREIGLQNLITGFENELL